MTPAKTGAYVLGSIAVILAISAPIIYWGVAAGNAAEAACQRKGGIYYSPRGAPGICLKANAVVR